MFKTAGTAALAFAIGILLFAATRPDTFRVERAAEIQAPPEAIFPLLNDLHRYPDWSPWERLDPDMKRSLSGAPSGEGAVYAWEGNRDVGKGRLEITESAPPSRVVLELDYREPFEAHNGVEFLLEPRGDSTRVTWATYGPSSYVMKVVCLFFDMDRTLGPMLEEGLENLRVLAEGDAPAP